MKKVFITTFALSIMLGSTLSAQTNLNFENWTGTEPNGWSSSNAITQSAGGSQTVFKETANPGQGSASVKMVTGSCPDCPNFSILGPFGPPTPLPDPLGGSVELGTFASSGVPYTSRPISFDIRYKSNPIGNDAAVFWVELTRYDPINDNTETIGEGYFEANTLVADWTNVNVPIAYYSNLSPDHMRIWATSSIGSIPDLSALGVPAIPGIPTPVVGSEFYLDAIVFNLPSCAGFTVSVSGTNETSIGANDGTAMATPNGGASPYTYSWSDLSSSQTINGLIPGYYSVTVTDANQCQKVGTYYVAPGGCNLSVSLTGTNSSTNSIFTGNGTVAVNASGGNLPYDYTWNTGETSSSVSNLPVGTYAVLVSEQNNPNCAVWGYYTVYGPNGGVVGINPHDLKNNISVYPNPSQDILNIASKEEIQSLKIYYVSGQLIQEISKPSSVINISHLPVGMYFVEMNAVRGKKYIQQIVKQ